MHKAVAITLQLLQQLHARLIDCCGRRRSGHFNDHGRQTIEPANAHLREITEGRSRLVAAPACLAFPDPALAHVASFTAVHQFMSSSSCAPVRSMKALNCMMPLTEAYIGPRRTPSLKCRMPSGLRRATRLPRF